MSSLVNQATPMVHPPPSRRGAVRVSAAAGAAWSPSETKGIAPQETA